VGSDHWMRCLFVTPDVDGGDSPIATVLHAGEEEDRGGWRRRG
jgi:hypothetical protein